MDTSINNKELMIVLDNTQGGSYKCLKAYINKLSKSIVPYDQVLLRTAKEYLKS